MRTGKEMKSTEWRCRARRLSGAGPGFDARKKFVYQRAGWSALVEGKVSCELITTFKSTVSGDGHISKLVTLWSCSHFEATDTVK
jgi:hypothetical protein